MTHEETQRILLLLKVAYPHGDSGLDPTHAQARDGLYAKVIARWDYAQAERGVESAVLRCRFYPTVAELREHYEGARSIAYVNDAPRLAPAGAATPDEHKAALAKVRALLDGRLT